jgi:erythromycin esterase-like protein
MCSAACLRWWFAVALTWAACVHGALPGVTEFRSTPERVTDSELRQLLPTSVSSASVVAIGETVHGSSGLLRVQDRLIRHLVSQHDMRLLVWETGVSRSMEMDLWLASCAQQARPAPLDVLYFPTAADAPLFEWLCAYNRENPRDPVRFRGMDVWDRPWEHYTRIASERGGAGPEADRHAQAVNSCPGRGLATWKDVDSLHATGGIGDAAAYARCRDALTRLMDIARETGTSGRARGDPGADGAFEVALSASTLLGWLGFHHYAGTDDVASWNERDRAQGRNLMLIMERYDRPRAILSAHSSHVSHNRSPADWWGHGDLRSGVHFYEALTGRRVYNIALTAWHATGAQGDWLQPTAVNSMDRRLKEAGHAFAFFLADAPFLSAHATWWMQNGNFAGPYASGVEIRPADHFDAYVFLDRSPLDTVLPARPVWQP